jgi:hypothetical protein
MELENDPALGGRPTEYKPEYAEQALKLCSLGATDVDLADFFGVSDRTIYRWAAKHEEFCQALKAGKDVADERVVRSLYHKAVGYTFDSEKVFNNNGVITRAKSREHVPPDTTAGIFWLKNRRRGEWRDKQDLEHTGADGGPIQTEATVIDAASMTSEERATMRSILVAAQARKGKEGG